MHEAMMEALFDALTTYDCRWRRDIADINGWTVGTVDRVLAHARKPEVVDDWGWTVPHVPHGTGDHLFQIVLVDHGATLDADEHQHVRNGAISTLRTMASHGENEGHALRIAAQYLSAAQARLVRQTATAAEGAAAMARQAAEVLAP